MPGTTFFDYPSIESIAHHVLSELKPAEQLHNQSKISEPLSLDSHQSRVVSSRDAPVFTAKVVESIVTNAVSSILGDVRVSGDTSLMDAGIDSLAAAELAQQLGGRLETALPTTLIFDYPSILSISTHLTNDLE